jgi:hypothetical protein
MYGYEQDKNVTANEIDEATKYAKFLNDLLHKIHNEIKVKYAKYTKEKMLRDLWKYTFETPMLPFDVIWDLSSDSLHVRNIEKIKPYVSSISGGERFYLAFWFQQYSSALNDSFFKFNDIPGLVSISDKEMIHFLIKVFEKYPYLVNGDFDKNSLTYKEGW